MDIHKNYYFFVAETILVAVQTDQAQFLQKGILRFQPPPHPSSTDALIPYHYSYSVNYPTVQEVNISSMSSSYHQTMWNKHNFVTST